ncbi:hypothetical protein U1872_12375 [Sphingomonas sp. RB3P16]|uniref:hypothetical protein n=1 Tax=Parasphingomonas frigoris TaxID=3096163 RepID=UPI002FC68201
MQHEASPQSRALDGAQARRRDRRGARVGFGDFALGTGLVGVVMGQESYVEHRPFEGAECLISTAGPFAASADSLNGWVAQAASDRMCIYARGQSVPRGVGARAMMLMAQGLIHLRRTRHAVGGPLFDYAARRTALPLDKARIVPISTTLAAETRHLFDILARLADDAARCPSNEELAALIGVRGAKAAHKHLAKLSEANMISIRWDADFAIRQVEILESGAKTGMGL